MGNSVQELLEMLYETIREARGFPLVAEKCVIERDKALDLLDEIRAKFPTELAEAKRLVDARAEFIANAKREAETIRKAAEERAKQLVNEQEITRAAKEKSSSMISAAEKTSAELRRVANEYVDDAMKRTEDALAQALGEIKNSRSSFRTAVNNLAQKQPAASDADIDVAMDE